jgi:hypothetical protein
VEGATLRKDPFIQRLTRRVGDDLRPWTGSLAGRCQTIVRVVKSPRQ